jgi:hypothetical protein
VNRHLLTGLAFLALATPASAQSSGAISGVVTDAQSGLPVANVLVTIEDGRRGSVTDSAGRYRIREVRAGVHSVQVTLIGYQPQRRDSLLVRAGGTLVVDFVLRPSAVQVEEISIQAASDPVLDPLATATEQKVTGEEIRRLPVSTLDEAISLSAGAVGQSYRGGRVGQESFVLDGMGVKNQLDA